MPLPDHCFAAPGDLLPLETAIRLIGERVSAVTESSLVSLDEADGRVLAEPLAAPFDLPPFANAAVDGFAVRFDDLRPDGATRLPIVGRVPAGSAAPPATAGTAMRIFTGAPIPAGHDTVVMQEDVRVMGGLAAIPVGIARGANVRRAGEDITEGAVALEAGRRLRPADLALAAALGRSRLLVRRPLRAALFSTGAELVDPRDGQPEPGRRFDANRPMLAALLRRLGCHVTDRGILPDRLGDTEAALVEAAGSHDLLVTSGGVSSGEEDHVRAAVERAGSLAFWRVAVKPGRPVALGTIDGAACLGLPGNPVAAFVTFATLGRALVAALAGERHLLLPSLPVAAGFTHRKRAGLREYVRVRVRPGPTGPVALKHGLDGSGIITSLTEADGLAVLADDTTLVEPGAPVGFLPFTGLI